ncbi:MAG: hypothetical protein HY717_09210 [Planctomycetes bacterium]|nr:hypothetical protein [Planctomycetota bacterium]
MKKAKRRNSKSNTIMQEVTRDSLKRDAENIARLLGLASAEEAFCQLDKGKLEGTIAETELRGIRHLQEVLRKRRNSKLLPA